MDSPEIHCQNDKKLEYGSSAPAMNQEGESGSGGGDTEQIVILKSREILDSVASVHNLNGYLSDLSALNSKYWNDYCTIYLKHWANPGKDGTCSQNSNKSLWIKKILEAEKVSMYRKQEIFNTLSAGLIKEIKDFLNRTSSSNSRSLWADAYKSMNMPTARDPSGNLGKWESGFLKLNTRLMESSAKLEKLKAASPLNEKKIMKEEVIHNELLEKWKPESESFFKKVKEMDTEYELFVPQIMEKYLALMASIVDVTSNGLEDIRQSVAGKDDEVKAMDGSQSKVNQMKSIVSESKHNLNPSHIVDGEGYSVKPQTYVDPFQKHSAHDSSDEEAEVSKPGHVIQVSIKQDVIAVDKEEEEKGKNVMETLAMKLASSDAMNFKPRSRTGSSAVNSMHGKRYSGRPVISSSRDSGAVSNSSSIPMDSLIEENINSNGASITSPALDEAVSYKFHSSSVSILVEEKCNCIFTVDGEVERILTTGEISLLQKNSYNNYSIEDAGKLIPSSLWIDNFQTGNVEKIVENSAYLFMIPDEIQEFASNFKRIGYEINIEGVNSELQRLLKASTPMTPHRHREENARLPLLKYLVSNQKSKDNIPIQVKGFWKKNENHVDLLIMYNISPEFSIMDNGEFEICAYIDGSSEVGTVVGEPLVEWNLDARKLRWIVTNHDLKDGRLVARIETCLGDNDEIGVKPIDVGFKFHNICIAELVVDFKPQSILKDNNQFEISFIYQSGVFQFKGQQLL